MSILSRALNRLKGSAGSTAGSLPAHWPINWFQRGYSTSTPFDNTCASVEACVSAYAQTLAQCPAYHYKEDDSGVREKISTSNVARLLRKPNEFQSRSDFFLNLTNMLLKQGNSYFFGDGDTPRSHSQLTLLDPRSTMYQKVEQSSEYFYRTSGLFAEMGDISEVVIPSRYVAHFRLFTPQDPLVGVTPITYASQSIAANNAITSHQAAFFSNMSRPSGALVTDQKLTKQQSVALREAWEEQAKNLNSGGVPILSNGLKWEPLSITSQDAELVNAWRMTIEEISRVFRVPPMLVNNMENATFNNAEALMSFWLSSGLGFLISHVEQTLSDFFRLPAGEVIAFDTSVLMRSDLETLIRSLGEGVTKGLYAPNEGRARLGLPAVDNGEKPRIQQQMVTLDWQGPAVSDPSNPNPNPPAQDQEPEDEPELDEEDVEAQLIEAVRKAA